MLCSRAQTVCNPVVEYETRKKTLSKVAQLNKVHLFIHRPLELLCCGEKQYTDLLKQTKELETAVATYTYKKPQKEIIVIDPPDRCLRMKHKVKKTKEVWITRFNSPRWLFELNLTKRKKGCATR